MLKPSDLEPPPAQYTQDDLDQVEKQFDAAITAAHRNNRWPAVVSTCRDAIPQAAVEAVAVRYREFWSVDTGGHYSRAIITHRVVVTA
jgi:hypothetical protein